MYFVLAADIGKHVEHGLAVFYLHSSNRKYHTACRNYACPLALKVHAVVYSSITAYGYGDGLLGGIARVLIVAGIAGIVLIAGLLARLGPLLCLRAGSVLTSRLAALAAAGAFLFGLRISTALTERR